MSDEQRLLDAMLKQYETVRAESIAAIGNRLTVMNFTFAALSVMTAGLLTRQVSDALAGVIAIVFVPQFGKAGLLVWLGEHERSQRAGRYLRALEVRICAAVGQDTLGWETWLERQPAPTGRESSLHMRYPYIAVVVLLVGVGWAGEALGVYLLAHATSHRPGSPWSIVIPVAAGAACLLVEGCFLRFFSGRWRAIR